jgi:hypothetical protein
VGKEGDRMYATAFVLGWLACSLLTYRSLSQRAKRKDPDWTRTDAAVFAVGAAVIGTGYVAMVVLMAVAFAVATTGRTLWCGLAPGEVIKTPEGTG